jgi:hypothetical protein
VDLRSGWHGGERLILAARTSDDGGRTWSPARELEHSTDGTWYDYPAVYWTGDLAHVAYRCIIGRGSKWQAVDVRYQRLPKAWFLESGR